jgi:hypothetical protein
MAKTANGKRCKKATRSDKAPRAENETGAEKETPAEKETSVEINIRCFGAQIRASGKFAVTVFFVISMTALLGSLAGGLTGLVGFFPHLH